MEPSPSHSGRMQRVKLRVRGGVDVDGGEAAEGESSCLSLPQGVDERGGGRALHRGVHDNDAGAACKVGGVLGDLSGFGCVGPRGWVREIYWVENVGVGVPGIFGDERVARHNVYRNCFYISVALISKYKFLGLNNV